jgi:hypothetical protein
MPVRVQWLRAESLANLGRTREAKQALANAEQRLATCDGETMLALAKTRYALGDVQECQNVLVHMESLGLQHPGIASLRQEIQGRALSGRNIAQQPNASPIR